MEAKAAKVTSARSSKDTAERVSRLHVRNGVYYFRQKIPVDLQEHFHGKTEIKRSLKTRDSAEAHSLFDILANQTDGLFLQIRLLNKVSPMSELTKQQIQTLVAEYFEKALEESEDC